MILQPLKREGRDLGVRRVLPGQNLEIARHRETEHEHRVQTPPYPLGESRVRHAAHKQADVKVPTPHGEGGQLLLCLRTQHDVVHQDENTAFRLQPFLLP